MNYEKIYNTIISNAMGRVNLFYTEKHHIIPRFMGGSDAQDNLIALTPREHFLCHVLLTKFVPNDKKYAAVKSVYMTARWNYSNENYIKYKPALSKKIIRLAHPPMPEETRKKISNAAKAQFENPEKRLTHLSAVQKRFKDPAEIQKLSIAQKARFEKDEERKKVSDGLKKFFNNNISPNKGRSFDHLTVEERKKIFGRPKRVQSDEEKSKRANKLRKPRSAEAKANIKLGALKREAAKRAAKL